MIQCHLNDNWLEVWDKLNYSALSLLQLVSSLEGYESTPTPTPRTFVIKTKDNHCAREGTVYSCAMDRMAKVSQP